MSRKARKPYSLGVLVKGCDENPLLAEDQMTEISGDERPSYEASETPFAYRIIDWRGQHVAVVKIRERAHELRSQNDLDTRLNCIYALYTNEKEKLIQGGLSVMEAFDQDNFEAYWREIMLKINIESDEIENTLTYYRDNP